MFKTNTSSDDFIEFSNINFVLNINNWQVLFAEAPILQLIPSNNTLTNKDLKAIIHADDLDLIHDAYAKLLDGKTIGTVKVRALFNSKIIWLSILPMLVHKSNEQLLMACIQVITAEVENLETTLKFTNKKNSILQMLSHDLRGPLTIAKSVIEVIERSDISKEHLKKIQAVSAIIAESMEMIGDLVNEEFLDTVEAPLVKRRIDIAKKLYEYVEQCKQAKNTSEKRFTFISSSTYILLPLDEAKFMQVVNNLISNALKFTQNDGHIAVILEEHKTYVSIIFKDNGIGIPLALQPFLFDRYTIAKRVGLKGEPTTGLGLFIVKEIITWHHATIKCHSKEGEGTSFIINFPKQKNESLFSHYSV